MLNTIDIFERYKKTIEVDNLDYPSCEGECVFYVLWNFFPQIPFSHIKNAVEKYYTSSFSAIKNMGRVVNEALIVHNVVEEYTPTLEDTPCEFNSDGLWYLIKELLSLDSCDIEEMALRLDICNVQSIKNVIMSETASSKAKLWNFFLLCPSLLRCVIILMRMGKINESISRYVPAILLNCDCLNSQKLIRILGTIEHEIPSLQIDTLATEEEIVDELELPLENRKLILEVLKEQGMIDALSYVLYYQEQELEVPQYHTKDLIDELLCNVQSFFKDLETWCFWLELASYKSVQNSNYDALKVIPLLRMAKMYSEQELVRYNEWKSVNSIACIGHWNLQIMYFWLSLIGCIRPNSDNINEILFLLFRLVYDKEGPHIMLHMLSDFFTPSDHIKFKQFVNSIDNCQTRDMTRSVYNEYCNKMGRDPLFLDGEITPSIYSNPKISKDYYLENTFKALESHFGIKTPNREEERLKYMDCLCSLFVKLVSGGYIAPESSQAYFCIVFSGWGDKKDVAPKSIVWTGRKGQFCYFIERMSSIDKIPGKCLDIFYVKDGLNINHLSSSASALAIKLKNALDSIICEAFEIERPVL